MNKKREKERKGRFIVLYGINNTGKSTQCKKIVNKLATNKIFSIYKKYPDYDITPSGKIISDYLRKGNPLNLSPREFQIFQVVNREQVEPQLTYWLRNGTWVIAEDYTGTGIAWGMGSGVDENFLEYSNSHLLKEDLAILLDGKRFDSGIEKGHKHEQDNDLTEKVRKVHLHLSHKKGWPIVKANQPEDKVFNDIWGCIEKLF
jgi:dTMP kinase